MTASSPRRRARIVAGFVLVTGLLAASACSAGQITQTSRQVAAVPGINASVGPAGGDTTVALRDVVIAYNGPEGYAAGKDAPLVVRLFNVYDKPVALTGVTAQGAAAVVLAGGSSPATPAATPTATASPAVDEAPGETSFRINIPVGGYVLLVPGEGQHLVLHKLATALTPGESIPVTFTFSDGGTVTIPVPVGLPTVPAPRSPMDIGHEE